MSDANREDGYYWIRFGDLNIDYKYLNGWTVGYYESLGQIWIMCGFTQFIYDYEIDEIGEKVVRKV